MLSERASLFFGAYCDAVVQLDLWLLPRKTRMHNRIDLRGYVGDSRAGERTAIVLIGSISPESLLPSETSVTQISPLHHDMRGVQHPDYHSDLWS
jgi:hypothetical protein